MTTGLEAIIELVVPRHVGVHGEDRASAQDCHRAQDHIHGELHPREVHPLQDRHPTQDRLLKRTLTGEDSVGGVNSGVNSVGRVRIVGAGIHA